MFKPFNIDEYTPELKNGEEILTTPTDSKQLNELLGGGISTSEFILIQAAAGRGKTTILERLALRAAVTKFHDSEVAFVSLGEQSDKTIFEQILCMNSGVDYKREYKKLSNEERIEKFEKIKHNLKGFKDRLKIYYTREPFKKYYYNKYNGTTVESLKDVPEESRNDYRHVNDFSLIMEDIVKRKIKFVFIDYVGAENADPAIPSRYEGLKTLCDKLAYLAEKENMCIVGGIQTNKNYLAYLEDENFNPKNVNELYTADSINTMRKATVGISFIRQDGKDYAYFNVFKGRYVDTGLVKIKVHPRTYRWFDYDEDMGFTD